MIGLYFKLLLNAKNNSNNYYIIYFLSQSYNHHMDNDMIYNIYIIYILYNKLFSIFLNSYRYHL